MRKQFEKSIFVFVVCLSFFLGNILWAEDMKNSFVVSEPLVLHTLSPEITGSKYPTYESAEIFVDANDNIIAVSSFKTDPNSGERKVLVSVFHNNDWITSSATLTGYPQWHGMINNGAFEVYAIKIPQHNDPVKVQTISIYNLTSGMKLSSQPTKIIKVDETKKTFNQESYKIITQLLPLKGSLNKFFIVGYYVEYSLNPIDITHRIISAGHWGFVQRPFGAIVENGEIIGFYNTPDKFKTNDSTELIRSIVNDDTINTIWIQTRDYCTDPKIIKYSQFNLSDKSWAESEELFRGYKREEILSSNFFPPSMAYYKESLYCTWYWSLYDESSGRKITKEENGIYFCERINKQWEKPVKIADSDNYTYSYIVVDNDGIVYVLWVGNEGLCCKVKTAAGWMETSLLVNDKKIKAWGGHDTLLGTAVDKNNNIHILYIRKGKPQQFMYVKLTPVTKTAETK